MNKCARDLSKFDISTLLALNFILETFKTLNDTFYFRNLILHYNCNYEYPRPTLI